MNEEIAEYYEELYNLCAVEQEQPLARRYRQLREALERVMRQQMMGTGLQATDLAAVSIMWRLNLHWMAGSRTNCIHSA